ncbi:hypothetical protein M758_9G003800 [Ceratodon purpureus]|nr:hypothetical protein M758_9G003800 [Ceratodon purpureus]
MNHGSYMPACLLGLCASLAPWLLALGPSPLSLGPPPGWGGVGWGVDRFALRAWQRSLHSLLCCAVLYSPPLSWLHLLFTPCGLTCGLNCGPSKLLHLCFWSPSLPFPSLTLTHLGDGIHLGHGMYVIHILFACLLLFSSSFIFAT